MAEASPCNLKCEGTSVNSSPIEGMTGITSAGDGASQPSEQKPICVIVLGMAGSGKTTFVQVQTLCVQIESRLISIFCLFFEDYGYFIVLLTTVLFYFLLQRLTAHLHTRKCPPYVINLDPAVVNVPYPANIGKRLKLSYLS